MIELTTTRHNPLIDPSLHVWGWEIPVYLFLGGLEKVHDALRDILADAERHPDEDVVEQEDSFALARTVDHSQQ